MPRTILLGPILNRNRARLVERCADLLRAGRGREFLYLAASKPLLDSVTTGLLDGDGSGAVGQLGVHLLSGFSRRVLAGARFADTGEPLPYFQPVDRELRPLQRPLLARIIGGLAEAGELKSFGPLAKTDGVVASVAALVGEIQRAGKTAEEFRAVVERRAALEAESKPARVAPDLPPEGEAGDEEAAARRREAERIAAVDYDRDAALIYERYSGLLDAHNLTDASRDYLRALEVLRGEFRGRPVRVPFLDDVRLLVVDGFFDLVPVHAETLSALVARVPETVVNLNYDESNPDAFAPFKDVIERFAVDEKFAREYSDEHEPVDEGLVPLRAGLFRVDRPAADGGGAAAVVELTAPDRLREVRAVAKRVKRLVVEEGVAPAEIGVVVRSRERYEPMIRSVFADEGIATTLDERRALADVPSVRAAMKVLDAAASDRARDARHVPVKKLTALLKTDFFSPEGPARVGAQPALPFDGDPPGPDPHADEVENAAAFVGADLHLEDWLRRAHRLLDRAAREDRARSIDQLADIGEAGEADDEGRELVAAERRRGRVRDDYPADGLRAAVGALERLGGVLAGIPSEAPAREMAAAYLGALAGLGLERRLSELAAEAFPDERDMRRAALDLRGFEALGRAAAAVVDAAELAAEGGGGAITRSAFRADLERAVSAVELFVAPPREGGVRVLTATDVRGLAFDTVFVLGLVEGEFPARARGDWIYPQSERESFREMGLPLEDLSPGDMLRKEEHYFYQAACRARRGLVLCRPLAGDDDSETVASYFVGETAALFGGGLTPDHEPAGFDGETLEGASTPAELARAVVRADCRVRAGAAGAPDAGLVLALAEFAREPRPGQAPIVSGSAMRRIAVERMRDGDRFTPYDGVIEDEALRGLLARAYAAHLFSASELNAYGNCPFRFFLERVLGLRPRVEAALDLQALDVGVLLHDVLRQFFARHGASLGRMGQSEALAAMAEVAGEIFDRFERGMPPLNPKLWKIERQTLGILLDRFLVDELERRAAMPDGAPEPAHFELAFGMRRSDADGRSTEKPLGLTREGVGGPEVAYFRGQIDRLDRSEDGVLVAYDYKMSQGPGRSDMEQGRDTQLALYLEAIEQLFAGEGDRVAGGGYYALRITADRRKHGLFRADFSDRTGVSSRASALAPDAWRALRGRIIDGVWRKLDGIRGGAFRVDPSKGEATCKHCDYPLVCRYDRYRIRGKRAGGGDGGADA